MPPRLTGLRVNLARIGFDPRGSASRALRGPPSAPDQVPILSFSGFFFPFICVIPPVCDPRGALGRKIQTAELVFYLPAAEVILAACC